MNEQITNEDLKEAHKKIYELYQRDNQIVRIDWRQEKSIFFEKYNNVSVLTHGGLSLRHKIFKIIDEIEKIQEVFEGNNKDEGEYIFQLENFIFRSIQLRNILLYFFKEGIQSFDEDRYITVKEFFDKNLFLSQLKDTYRNELTHKGYIFSIVHISDDKHCLLPKPIIYLPDQKLANEGTYEKWRKEWAYSIKYYLCLIKKLFDKILF